MKSLIAFSLLGIFLGTAPTFAQGGSPFDTMREAFNMASAPATIHDFDQGKWKSCIFSDVSNPFTTRPTQVRTLQYMSSGNGPLFPGNDDFRVDVFSDYSLDNNLFSFFQNSCIKETPTYFLQTLDGPPWRHMNILGKLDREMLLFSVEMSDFYGPQAPMYPRVYGYCWNTVPNREEEGGGEKEQPLPLPVPKPSDIY
ncbi:MAG: hypothetical protein ACXVB1_03365 [Pseudobdellovibrionaceae bacterium]